jgi:hypothetical protein
VTAQEQSPAIRHAHAGRHAGRLDLGNIDRIRLYQVHVRTRLALWYGGICSALCETVTQAQSCCVVNVQQHIFLVFGNRGRNDDIAPGMYRCCSSAFLVTFAGVPAVVVPGSGAEHGIWSVG